MQLKLINKDDLEFATNLRNSCRECFFNSNLVTLDDTRKWYEELDPEKAFFIMWEKGERIGTISINGEGEIGNVAVVTEYRLKGYLKEAINQVRQFSQTPLKLEVLPENKVAIKAYQKCGFKVTKVVMEAL